MGKPPGRSLLSEELTQRLSFGGRLLINSYFSFCGVGWSDLESFGQLLIYRKVLSKTFEVKGRDRKCWERTIFKELPIRGHEGLKKHCDRFAEDEAESHIGYLPVRCCRFQAWVCFRIVLLPLCLSSGLDILITQNGSVWRQQIVRFRTDTSFTCPSLLKKKKTWSKMALKRGRQTSRGWYATATSVKLGETADWDIFDMSAELTCWTTLLLSLSKLAVGSWSHLNQFESRNIECYSEFLTFSSLSRLSRCRLHGPVAVSSGEGESSVLTKTEAGEGLTLCIKC